MRFRTGAPQDEGFGAYASLPLAERDALCRSLLAEFGVTEITERGSELVCSCPLPFGLHSHGDANPSFALNVEKLTASCWVCGGGGLLWFIATCRGSSATAAKAWLRDRTDITESDPEALQALLAFLDELEVEAPDHPSMPKLNPKMLDPWAWIHPLVLERGVPEETVIAQRVGYNPEVNRIVIPHFWREELVGWQTRQVVKDGTPKYLSSTAFPKRETLYHLPPGHQRVVVVESPMSVLRHMHHVPDLCATFGASTTDQQARLLADYDRVILWLDPDGAGWRGTETLVSYLERYTSVWVVGSPFNVDVADLPDVVVDDLLEHELVPASLWKRPHAASLVAPERLWE